MEKGKIELARVVRTDSMSKITGCFLSYSVNSRLLRMRSKEKNRTHIVISRMKWVVTMFMTARKRCKRKKKKKENRKIVRIYIFTKQE